MKGLKLSKTGWLILAAGVFVVILAGLGLTRSQQLKEQSKLEEELSISTMRVDTVQISHLRPQLDELHQKIDESKSQLNEVKDRLRQTVVSVDVTEKLFAIAEYCDVVVYDMANTTISFATIEGVDCLETSISAIVNGEVEDIVDFLIGLNDGYATGYVQSVQITIPDDSSDNEPSAYFQMVVYSYEGD